MQVHLNPELDSFVRSQVDGGAYGSADEVVADALQALRQRKLAWLRAAIQNGLNSGPAEPLDMADIRRRAFAQLAAEQRQATE